MLLGTGEQHCQLAGILPTCAGLKGKQAGPKQNWTMGSQNTKGAGAGLFSVPGRSLGVGLEREGL